MPIKHEWNGTILTITSDSGTSSADLQGVKGATGARGARGLTGRTGGGALIEDGVIRDDTTWSSAGIMDRFAEAFSTEGNPVVCDNALANVPFNIITEIDVKQEGTGEPYPAGTGKNKLNFPNVASCVSNGITMECNNGVLKFSGTATGVVYTNSKGIVDSPVVPNGSYKVVGGTANVDVLAKLTTNGTTKYFYKGETFTLDDTTKLELITCRITSGTAISGTETIYPMLVSASETDLSYEPYSNIRPFVSYDTINIARSGKNILPFPYPGKSTTTNGITYTINADGTITARGTAIQTEGNYNYTNFSVYPGFSAQPDTMFALPAGRYKLVCKGSKNTNLLYAVIYKRIGTNDYKNMVSTRNAEFATFKTDEYSDKYYLMVACRSTYSPNETLQIMIVPADETDLTYEVYKGETFTLSLGDTYYGGSIDWNTGEMIVDKYGVVLNGTENWAKAGDGTATNAYRFYLWESQYIPYLQPCINDYKPHETLICSHYTTLAYMDIPKGKTGIGVNPTVPTPVLGIYNPLFANYTVDEFKAELAKEHITITYGLAEPQVIKLEPQIIKALSGTNTLLTNADNIQLVGRYDAMKTIQELLARVSALEAKVGE